MAPGIMAPLSGASQSHYDEPGPFSVICARGKKAKNHSGNQHYRMILQQHVGRYSKASSKLEKSLVVSEIVESVRFAVANCKSSSSNPSCGGAFVKQQKDGTWLEVSDEVAREKVGANLRDMLHSQYKSSTKSKWRRRKNEIATKFESIVSSNDRVRQRTKQLMDEMAAAAATTKQAPQQGAEASSSSSGSESSDTDHHDIDDYIDEPSDIEDDVLFTFTQANCDILNLFKMDSLQAQAV